MDIIIIHSFCPYENRYGMMMGVHGLFTLPLLSVRRKVITDEQIGGTVLDKSVLHFGRAHESPIRNKRAFARQPGLIVLAVIGRICQYSIREGFPEGLSKW